MSVKLGINQKPLDSHARFTCATVASKFLNVFTFDSPEIREIKRREKVRCDLVKSQFGICDEDQTPPLIDRLGQLLKLN